MVFLIKSSCFLDFTDIAKNLIEIGAYINTEDKFGDSPFEVALKNGESNFE